MAKKKETVVEETDARVFYCAVDADGSIWTWSDEKDMLESLRDPGTRESFTPNDLEQSVEIMRVVFKPTHVSNFTPERTIPAKANLVALAV